MKISGRRYNTGIIVLAIDMYFNGMSFRKVSQTINDNFGTAINHSTVSYWVEKYVPRIVRSMQDLVINNSNTILHIDEMFVKMRGTSHQHKIGYLWNVIDEKTRFLLTSYFSTTRSAVHARVAIRDALGQLRNKPKKIVTDNYQGYIPVIARTGIPHDAVTFEDGRNNMVERLNGIIRQRIKVLRGFKSLDTAIPAGIMINYNYVTPHGALDGQTPAQAMGVFRDRLRWGDLWDRMTAQQELTGS